MPPRKPRRALLSLLLPFAAACALHSETPPTAIAPAPDAAPLRIGFVVVDGVYNTELMAPWDVLEHAGRTVERPTEIFVVSPDGEPVTTAEGLRIAADFGFDDAPPIDLLVVPSAEGSRDVDRENRRLIEWVAAAGAAADQVVSLCWGAFILAEAGLLDGRSATTFPSDYAVFAQAFPKVDVKVNVSFVHDGPALTSQGGVKSYDVAMYLVDRLFGADVATRVGAGLLIPWPAEPAIPHVTRGATGRTTSGAGPSH